MTMKIKIEHIEGNSYAALVKQSDGGEIVLNVSESTEISMHSGKSVTITEIGTTAVAGSVPDAPVPTPVDPAPAETAPQAA